MILGTAIAAPEQETYKSHTVTKGETVYSIAQKYGVSEEAIYRLNPDARRGIDENSILILPASNNNLIVSSFKNHRTKRRETLYGIAQNYGVSVEDIKKYNKFLYSRELDKGDKLRIPVFEKTNIVISPDNPPIVVEEVSPTHTVAPKETLYGIARKYGTTIEELKILNPNLEETLPIGLELKVPGAAIVESASLDDENYDFYEVQPKEGFYRLEIKLGLSQEEIVALNPYAKDGLKEGMILKLPKAAVAKGLLTTEKIDLENRIRNTNTKNIALMLPFKLQQVDVDSVEANENLLRRNRTLRIALDFYSGVLMAAEFAKEKGVSINLEVFDTEGSESGLMGVLRSNDFSNTDAVIGPLLSKNVQRAASELKSDGVPVVSPLSNRNIQLTSNMIQTLPEDKLLVDAMLEYLMSTNNGSNTVVVADAKNPIKSRLKDVFPTAHILSPREGGFLYVNDIQDKLIDEAENWVILESSNPVTISNVVGILNGLPETYQIRLFTTDRNDSFEYDDISNVHLAKLHFTFPSVSKAYDFNEKDAFLISYKDRYGVLPNRYASRGFDVAYDIILRLASAEDLYEGLQLEGQTEYIENRFQYDKKLFSGYINQAFYILRYNEELHFDILK